jgi:hypothetical protein
MTIKGPDAAYVGRRFNLEVFIANTGSADLQDLEVIAEMDPSLTQESGERVFRAQVPTVAPDGLQIVRLPLTPTKTGPGGVDITLRAKNGAAQQARRVTPLFGKEEIPPQPEPKVGELPLKATVTPWKDCFVERPTTFLVHVVNASAQPTENNLDLIVSYSTTDIITFGRGPLTRQASGFGGPSASPPVDGKHISFKGKGFAELPSNPIRQLQLKVPALYPHEGRTLSVVLTPRRIGELRVSVTRGTLRGAHPVVTSQQPSGQLLGGAAFQVKFDPNAPVARLLPAAPAARLTPRLPQNLADVPEISLEGPVANTLNRDEAFEHIAHMIDKINHVNTTKTDAFIEALMSQRPELAGVPFSMGAACRLQPQRASHFLTELTSLRQALANPNGELGGKLPQTTVEAYPARVAAMMQVLGPETPKQRHEMVKHLATNAQADSTRALASLAIFSEEDQVRQAALDALKTRPTQDYKDILVKGLSYPWPAVAQHACDAIVQLKRTDMLPQLVDVLERSDPRAPQMVEIDGKKAPVVRELVRINHFRNCLLCHSPASAEMATGQGGRPAVTPNGGEAMVRHQINGTTLTAPVPLPNQQLPTPSPSGGYGRFSIPQTLVRIDVTYLRQDFSLKLPVANAQPWPELQRFDFLVRSRVVADEDAQLLRDLLRPVGTGALSPYHRSAVTALRTLTGRDVEPTAAAWRPLLEQINREKSKG